MAPAAPGERTLQETPTWTVALVCAVFIIISLIIEHAIHALGKVRTCMRAYLCMSKILSTYFRLLVMTNPVDQIINYGLPCIYNDSGSRNATRKLCLKLWRRLKLVST